MAQDTENTEGTAPEEVHKDRNLHIIFGVTLMAVLGTSSISPAFPEVQEAFGVSRGQVALLITLFTLPGVLLTPVMGSLADRFGRRKILVPSLLLFGLAGGACALARSFDLLLALRIVQGTGAASLGALNITLVGDLYAGRTLTAAMGYNSGVLSVGAASYPAVGGALATFGWYYPFALPLAAIPVALLVLFHLDNPEPSNEQAIKEEVGDVWEHVKSGRVAGLFASTIVTFVVLFGPLVYYLPIFMYSSFGSSPLLTGAVVASASLTSALVSTQLGRLTAYFREETLIRASYVLYAASLCLVPLVPTLFSNAWPLFVPTILFGVAHSLNLPNAFSLLTAEAPSENRGAFLSINSTLLRLGQTLGPPLMAAGALSLASAAPTSSRPPSPSPCSSWP